MQIATPYIIEGGKKVKMRQQISRRINERLRCLKMVIILLVSLAVVFIVSSILIPIPETILPESYFVLIGLGILLAVIGILTNLERESKIKVGVINRAEFYGVVALFAYMQYMGNRIDQIMLILIQG